ncbi:MAG TPA: hypothetical protein VIH45_06560 [Desulfuromonadaceae bacterium]
MKRVIAGSAVFVVLVAAMCGCGSSTPNYPTTLSATIGAGRVYLSWSPASGAVSYNVYRGLASGPVSSKARIAADLTDTFYTDASVTAGTNYYYQVTGKDVSVTTSGGTQATTKTSETLPSNEAVGSP